MAEECVHGMEKEWCGLCAPRPVYVKPAPPAKVSKPRAKSAAAQAKDRKQDCLDSLSHLLGLGSLTVGPGGSIPTELFLELNRRYSVPRGTQPEIAEAVAAKAHVEWEEDCDDRDPLEGNTGTVTVRGMLRLIDAVKRLEE